MRVKFLESKGELKVANEELILSELVTSVKLLQDKGVKAGEIAILVRAKHEARVIADLFLYQKGLPENGTYNFEVLSSESLYIINSEVIAFIISVLTSFLNPDDQVVKAEANYLYYKKKYFLVISITYLNTILIHFEHKITDEYPPKLQRSRWALFIGSDEYVAHCFFGYFDLACVVL